ncbi:MAG TPA: PilX N-terminal domain-containing pilus assembly protein [Nitrospiraceae bacterium]|nr:PilX N-terminal domain-containing pilus assembly protein [Nitrospiraceae bacterium]
MKQPEMKSGSQYSGNEQGIALLTVMLLLLILTVLGVAAITTTSLEIRMAQYSSSTEGAAAAAESCTGTGVNIIAQTLNLGAVPTQYVVGGAGATSPVVPANAENAGTNPPSLTQEIFSQADNNGDVPTGPSAKPDLSFAVGPYTVAGDIDHMYNTQQSGAGLQFSGGYNGIGQGGGGDTQSIYRIDCVATNVATGTTNEVQAVYACLRMAGGCQKKSF